MAKTKDTEVEVTEASENSTVKTETALEKAKRELEESKRPVKIKIPLTRDSQDDVFVSVNGNPFQIHRGEEVEVPYYIAVAHDLSEASDLEALKKQKELAKG